MASGWKVMHGAFYGTTGVAVDVTKVGFRPSRVKLINVTSGDEMEWQEGMADGSGFKRVAAGTGALVASNAITPLANGFRLGTDADMNVTGELVRFECFE